MKATLTFDLDEPDDKIEHLRCVQSSELYSAVFDFIQNSRKRLTEKAVEVWTAILAGGKYTDKKPKEKNTKTKLNG